MQCSDVENVLSAIQEIMPAPAGQSHTAVFYGARVILAGVDPSVVVGFQDSDLAVLTPAQIAAKIVAQAPSL